MSDCVNLNWNPWPAVSTSSLIFLLINQNCNGTSQLFFVRRFFVIHVIKTNSDSFLRYRCLLSYSFCTLTCLYLYTMITKKKRLHYFNKKSSVITSCIFPMSLSNLSLPISVNQLIFLTVPKQLIFLQTFFLFVNKIVYSFLQFVLYWICILFQNEIFLNG